ncbi:hypothetical protein [uncultured Desulfobacter sp.]|uniref:hypothetical protein n=1 Tax=uncultured Desulfobacter sp. TaxID=240139 RepID=UPI0029F4B5DB|nr:hypothetical protein [uncultured Desulfobacter sp.]
MNRIIISFKKSARELNPLCDVLFVPTMKGVKDDNGIPLLDKQILPILTDTFAKPVIGDHKFSIEQGMLCGMAQAPEEQGFTAARMLVKTMQGTPVSEIPITQNHLSRARCWQIPWVSIEDKF